MRKPYLWRGAWYVKVTNEAGKRSQLKLHEDKEEAERIWHRMNASKKSSGPQATVLGVSNAFLKWSDRNSSEETAKQRLRYIGPFVKSCGHLTVDELRPFHVSDWLDEQPYKPGARRMAATSIKRVFAWAARLGRIPGSPIASLETGTSGRREQLISADAHFAMMASNDTYHTAPRRRGCFRAFLVALRHTGARPGEIAKVTAADVDLAACTWTLQKHKTRKKTNRPRIVYLTPCMLALTKMLMVAHPTGPLFLNRWGRPWTPYAIRCRMIRMREKLGLPAEVVAYSYRHTFTTDALARGVGTAAVAELLGHANSAMVAKHYSHLDQKPDHLRESLRKATG